MMNINLSVFVNIITKGGLEYNIHFAGTLIFKRRNVKLQTFSYSYNSITVTSM